MENDKFEFPKIKKTIGDFLEDEDGNITRSKLVTIGSMVLLLSVMYGMEVMAAHTSHVSHMSHASTSYIRSHDNSHTSHDSHSSHASHTSHSNTSTHSNSLYSEEGDVAYARDVSSIKGVLNAPKSNAELTLNPSVSNLNIAVPTIPKVADTQALQKIQDVDVE